MHQPLVSVICLCHNHNEFVEESIQSVLEQDYPNVELIVVDDGSSDGSQDAIEKSISDREIKFIPIEDSIGNCKAFNRGFQESSGEYVIDLAADDILLSTRISEGLKAFDSDKIGVTFCDTFLIDKNGNVVGTHYQRDDSGKLIEDVPQGDLYLDLIKRFFISAPTMLIRRGVLDQLGGYDENLSYEDFDFWIRSSRNWEYSFTDQLLVKKRILNRSHSTRQFVRFSRHQKSTLEVCRKIGKLNRHEEEDKALKKRCQYEIRQCIRQGNLGLIPGFLKLL